MDKLPENTCSIKVYKNKKGDCKVSLNLSQKQCDMALSGEFNLVEYLRQYSNSTIPPPAATVTVPVTDSPVPALLDALEARLKTEEYTECRADMYKLRDAILDEDDGITARDFYDILTTLVAKYEPSPVGSDSGEP